MKKNIKEGDVIDFGKEKKKRDLDNLSPQARALIERAKYKWILTFNEPGADEVMFVRYAPQKTWEWDPTKSALINAKEYLEKVAKDYKTKDGGLIIWKLDPDLEQPSEYFEEGEWLDIDELDSKYPDGEYKPFAIKHVNSFLQLVHY